MSEENYFIDQTNKKWFWQHLNTEEEVNEVCEYLSKNNLKIKMHPYGRNNEYCNVYLEGVDLSGNGCCFSGENLLNHVRYFRKLQEISKTEAFKQWLSKYKHFDLVRRNIIEKDQSWINSDQMKELVSKYNAE